MEKPDKIFTICYVLNNLNQVLLQKKARGFGRGNWNGPGGKKRPGETIEQAMTREVTEETRLIINTYEKRGELEFIFPLENNNFLTHVYVSEDWSGTPKDTGEGRLKWFDIDKLPLNKMWADDKYWLPELLSKKHKNIKMRFYFDQDYNIASYENLA